MSDLLAHLQSLEAELHHPGTRCSRARLEQLLHPGFHEVGRSGRKYTREMVIAHLSAEVEEASPPAIEAADYALTPLVDGCALLSYRSARRASDGRLHEQALRASIWLRGVDGWQLVHHQGTPADTASVNR
jgi:hypothetical protein